MIIRFTVDLPFALKEECVKELEKHIKQEINRAIQAYGIFEVTARVRPKGAPVSKEEEEEPFEGRKFWFERAMEED